MDKKESQQVKESTNRLSDEHENYANRKLEDITNQVNRKKVNEQWEKALIALGEVNRFNRINQ